MAIDLMDRSGKLNDKEAYRRQVFAREKESTTGIGEGIAIPHGKCAAVDRPGLAAMVIPGGVDFESLDDEPVTLMFLIAAPDTKDNVHLDVLSKLSVLLMDEEFTASLRGAESVEEFIKLVDKADEEKNGIDERLTEGNTLNSASDVRIPKILAVTSCPTGIAHTYRGSGGAKNVLTEQEINDADCIIVAADADVPMARFDGKKVIICQVSDGISKADELIERACAGDASVYCADTKDTMTAAGKSTKTGEKS